MIRIKALGRDSPVLWQRESLKDTRAEHENCETCCLGTLHSDDLKKSPKPSSICEKNGKDSRRDSCDADDVDVVAGNDFAACRVCEFPGSVGGTQEVRETFLLATIGATNTNTNLLRQHFSCRMCTKNNSSAQHKTTTHQHQHQPALTTLLLSNVH